MQMCINIYLQMEKDFNNIKIVFVLKVNSLFLWSDIA